MLKTKLLASLAVGLLMVPVASHAALVTQLIHFDDANNGWKWYSDRDMNFLFNPTNLNSATHCADSTSTSPSQDSCVLEGAGNGSLPRMTRPEFGPQSQGGSQSDPPIVSGTDQTFTLDSFYFLLNGQGNQSDNAITVSGGNASSTFNTFTFQLGMDYDAVGAPDVSFYDGLFAGSLAGPLVKDKGYVATFGTLFSNVTWIQFSGAKDAQVRLDCVVATFDGTTRDKLSDFSRGCGISGGGGGGGGGTAPEPGSLALVGLALLGAGVARKRLR